MKKIIIRNGLITGGILSIANTISTLMYYRDPDFTPNPLLSFATMILAYTFIYVGMKDVKKENAGSITFGKAFKTGFLITVLASGVYLVAWLIELYAFIPDYPEKYAEHFLKVAKAENLKQSELDKRSAEILGFKEAYKNPLLVIIMTLSVVFPIGFLVAIMSAVILRGRPKTTTSL